MLRGKIQFCLPHCRASSITWVLKWRWYYLPLKTNSSNTEKEEEGERIHCLLAPPLALQRLDSRNGIDKGLDIWALFTFGFFSLLNYGCLLLFSRQMDSAASISPSSCLNVSIRFLVSLVLFLFLAIRVADPSSPTDNPWVYFVGNAQVVVGKVFYYTSYLFIVRPSRAARLS